MSNIERAEYLKDSRLGVFVEGEAPPTSIYMPVGYDAIEQRQTLAESVDPDTIPNKHYRKYYPDELEYNKEIFPREIFHKFNIIRGQKKAPKGGLFGGLFGGGAASGSTEKTVGFFKGIVECYSEEDKIQYDKKRGKYFD